MRWGILADPAGAEAEVLARLLEGRFGDGVDVRGAPTWQRGEIDVVVIPEFRRDCLAPQSVERLRHHVEVEDRPLLGTGGGAVVLSAAGLVPPGFAIEEPRRVCCGWVTARVETMATPFTALASPGEMLRLPVRGLAIRYAGEAAARERAERDGRVVLRVAGAPVSGEADILALRDHTGNAVAMIPQPQYAADPTLQLGGAEPEVQAVGARLLRSVVAWRDDSTRRRAPESSR